MPEQLLNTEGQLLINTLKNDCQTKFNAQENKLIQVALKQLIDVTHDKKRGSGELYYLHPLRVAQIAVNEEQLGADSIIAALLHDCVQDELIESKEITENYNATVEKLLQGFNKISSLYTEKLSLNSENFIALLLTITKDVRIILLKLADRLDNIRQIKKMDKAKQLKIAQETRLLYAPIAHRLGLYHIKSELEDISLRHIDPEAYFSIANQLKNTKKERERYIYEFSKPIKEVLTEKGYSFEFKGRPKSVNSIYGKLSKKSIDISEIFDLFAIRIILDDIVPNKEKEECWNVYSLITNIYTPNPVRLRDWISTPRPSGYESLHTTVSGPGNHWVEVQIRTRRMDEVAEKGDAAHWKYKESGKTESNEQWLRQIRDVLENKGPDAVEELEEKKGTALSEIFVFTPQGDIKKLREGATILDFAYNVHTNVGDKCTGARVNEKLVSIKHKLQNGDTVEVITSKNQKPRNEWLNIAVSPRIKARIRRSINENEFKRAEIGKEILERKANQLKIKYNDKVILKMANHFKFKSALDFYQAIADEKVDIQNIKDLLVKLNQEKEEKSEETTEASAVEYVQRPETSGHYLIIDQNLVDVDYNLAKCCRPIPGDAIFGFVTIERGIQIHRKSCPNAKDLQTRYPYRVIPARWTDDSKESSFLAEVVVTGIDKLGIMNHISEVISKDHQVNMRSLAINTKDGIFQGFISVFVSNLGHLDTLLLNINRIKGVLKAERLDKPMV